MKRILLLLLAAVMCLCLCACDGTGDGSTVNAGVTGILDDVITGVDHLTANDPDPAADREPTPEPDPQPDQESDTAAASAPDPAAEQPEETGPHSYVLNTNSKKFHDPDCGSASRMSEENKDTFQGAREELIEQGYTPCGNCDP